MKVVNGLEAAIINKKTMTILVKNKRKLAYYLGAVHWKKMNFCT